MNLVKATYEATGSAVAGGLLQRIIYWFPKARIKREGELWVAHTLDWWAEETGFSHKMVKDALAKLRERGIVETTYRMFNGFRTTFIRLVSPDKWGIKGLTGEDQMVPTDEDHMGPPITESYDIEIQQGELLVAEKENTKPNVFKVPGGSSAAGVKALFEASKSKPKDPNKPEDLKIIWQKAMKEHTGILASLTIADLGKLKLCRKALPPGKGDPIIAYALQNWSSFVDEVKLDKGWKHGPATPDIGYLLKHVNSAHALWDRKTQKTQPAQADTAPGKLVAKKVVY